MHNHVRIVRDRQLAIRREMDRRGIALKQVEFDSGLPYATLLSYFPLEGSRDPAVIPASAVYALAEGRALPVDMLSLLLPPGLALVEVPEEVDLDRLAECFGDFLSHKHQFHRPESECGPAIGPNEDETLRNKVVALPLVGRVA